MLPFPLPTRKCKLLTIFMTTEQDSGKIRPGSSKASVPAKYPVFALRQKKALPEGPSCKRLSVIFYLNSRKAGDLKRDHLLLSQAKGILSRRGIFYAIFLELEVWFLAEEVILKSSNIHGSLHLPLNIKAFTPVPQTRSQADAGGWSTLYVSLQDLVSPEGRTGSRRQWRV